MKFNPLLLFLFALCFSLLCTSCTTTTAVNLPDKKILAVSEALDKLNLGIEEYGTAGVSAPLLTRMDSGFKFDLTRGTKTYFDESKTMVQGKSALSDQAVNSMGFGVSVQIDPTIVAAYDDKLRQYYADKSILDEKKALTNSAAKDEYLAALEAASKIDDPIERANKVVEAKRKLAESLAAPSTATPTYPTAITDGSDVPAATTGLATSPTQAEKGFNSDKFKEAQALVSALNSNGPVISNQAALRAAASNQVTEGIFKVLGSSEAMSKFADKIVLGGVMMVSVDPGWHTKEGFAADVSEIASYEWKLARVEVVEKLLKDTRYDANLRRAIAKDYGIKVPKNLQCTKKGDKDKDCNSVTFNACGNPTGGLKPVEVPCPDGAAGCRDTEDNVCQSYDTGKMPGWVSKIPLETNPLVAAVSPMSEIETFDLGDSYRRRKEFSLGLAAALRYSGLGVQAEFFEQYAKTLESDMNTRTQLTPINCYSNSGGEFGFQIGPTVRAVKDLGDRKSGRGEVLGRQSFPVLVLFGFDTADIRPRVQIEATGKLVVKEPYLRIDQSTNWLPLEFTEHRLSDKDRTRMAVNLNYAVSDLVTAMDANKSLYAPHFGTIEMLKKKTGTAVSHIMGSWSVSSIPVDVLVSAKEELPSPKLAQPTGMMPAEVEKNKSVNILITGSNLNVVTIANVNIATGAATITAREAVGSDAIKLTLTVTGDQPVIFELPLDAKKSGLGTEDKPVIVLSKPLLVKKDDSVTKFIYKSENKAYTLEVNNTAAPDKMIIAKELIVTDLQKNKPVSNVSAK